MHVSALIAAGGRGTRFGGDRPKQFSRLGGQTILERSVGAFVRCEAVHDIVVALPAVLAESPPAYLKAGPKPIEIVAGGARRRDSVQRAFARVAGRADVVVIHDAARPFVSDRVIRESIAVAAESGAAVVALPAVDTVKRAVDRVIVSTLPREEIYLAQTPQAFQTRVLQAALALEGDATDEAMLAEQAGHSVRIVPGDALNMKITTPADLALAARLLAGGAAGAPVPRIGNGYDLHRLVAGRPLVLGGVTIPFDKGLEGHSDADAVCHAVTDAVLGAAGAGDIGRHFPDTDAAWKGANSLELLRRAAGIMSEAGFAIGNVDVVVIAQRPKLVPYIDEIRANLAGALGCAAGQVSVKGKTNEGVDSMGAGESIAVHAVALLVGA